MQVIKVDNIETPHQLDNSSIQTLLAVFERSEAFVYQTDTVYGLSVNALDEKAVKRLFSIKRRPPQKAVPVMVKDIEMAKQIAYINPEKEKMLEKMWPGAVTVILKRRAGIPSALSAGGTTIGLRIPDSSFVQGLVEILNKPITGTSANLSRESPTRSGQEVINTLGNSSPSPQLIFDAGELESQSPSTVIDLTGDEPTIVRMGPVTKKDLPF